MKTIREHLNSLPEPYRTEAFEEVYRQGYECRLEWKQIDAGTALWEAFIWDISIKEFAYWNALYVKLLHNEPMFADARLSYPPVPNNRSNSDNSVFTTSDPKIIGALKHNPMNSTFLQIDGIHFGPPYFIYDHNKF